MPFPICNSAAHSEAAAGLLDRVGSENLAFHLLLMVMESFPKGCRFSNWLSGPGRAAGKLFLTLTSFPPFYRQILIYDIGVEKS